MPDMITTLATVPAIIALVNLGKRLGLPAKAALALAVLLGVGLSLAQWAWAGYDWYDAAASGLLLGLAAAGLYDLVPEGGAAQGCPCRRRAGGGTAWARQQLQETPSPLLRS